MQSNCTGDRRDRKAGWRSVALLLLLSACSLAPSAFAQENVRRSSVTRVVTDYATGGIVHARYDITGLTGGGATNLDGQLTAANSLGVPAVATGAVWDLKIGSEQKRARLRVGTDAEDGTTIVRPDDYHASTNARVWEISSFAGEVEIPVTSVNAQTGDVVIPTSVVYDFTASTAPEGATGSNPWTWTIPDGVTNIRWIIIGGGGGGGAGRRNATGALRAGGGGGGGAGVSIIDTKVADLPSSSVTITVGIAGAGGTPAASDGGGGGHGQDGTASTVVSGTMTIATAGGGNNGNGAPVFPGIGGQAGEAQSIYLTLAGMAGAAGGTTIGVAATTINFGYATGGGGGGGAVDSGNTAYTGGAGALHVGFGSGVGGAAGATGGGAGGNPPATPLFGGGGGGGGGNASGAGGPGGTGGSFGGGGGGGGGTTNGTAGGGGGAGGPGIVRAILFF